LSAVIFNLGCKFLNIKWEFLLRSGVGFELSPMKFTPPILFELEKTSEEMNRLEEKSKASCLRKPYDIQAWYKVHSSKGNQCNNVVNALIS
jgi:hypothetical protein